MEADSTIDLEQLTELVVKSNLPSISYERYKEIKGYIDRFPNLKFDHSFYTLTAQQHQEKNYARATDMYQLMKLTRTDDEQLLCQNLCLGSPINLHYFGFMPTVKLLGSESQLAEWLPKMESLEIKGCYAQTELGHGSNIRGLETTCTFDRNRKCFVVHSPARTSYKWWPGSMASFANHACVYGQLIIDGTRYGIHAFVVQIRDMQTHQPLEGITVGSIGGLQGGTSSITDNGYLGFNQVSVPLNALLNHYCSVDEQGNYTVNSGDLVKVVYGGMLRMRYNIALNSGNLVARAVMIAWRYSQIRRQFGNPERQVIDYQFQKHKIMTQMANSYVMHFVAARQRGQYDKDLAIATQDPKSPHMAFLHAIASSLKALFTTDSCIGTDIMRQSCGGHGYSVYSFIPFLYHAQVAGVTYEGDNYLLYQQVARYLLKYPGFADEHSHEYAGTLTQILHFLTQKLMEKIGSLGRENWNRSIQLSAIEAGKFFAMMFTQKTFFEIIIELQNPAIKQAFTILWEIYVITKILEHKTSVIRSAVCSPEQLRSYEIRKEALYHDLMPYAPTLAEGFGFADWETPSALASPNGKVYEELLQHARDNPLNFAGLVPKI